MPGKQQILWKQLFTYFFSVFLFFGFIPMCIAYVQFYTHTHTHTHPHTHTHTHTHTHMLILYIQTHCVLHMYFVQGLRRIGF